MVLYLTSKMCINKSPNTWGQVAYICKENICDAFLSPQKHLYDTSQVLFMCNVPFVPCPDYVTSINQGRLKKELQLPLYLGQGRTMLAQMQRRKFVCLLSKFIFNFIHLKIEEENSQNIEVQKLSYLNFESQIRSIFLILVPECIRIRDKLVTLVLCIS